MPRQSREERLAAIHDRALREFNDVQSALRDERLQALQDRRFYSIAGAQWEGPLWDIYENKPKFEVNKCMLSVMRIVNEYRNNRITVEFVSKDGKKAEKLAQICKGLYRADEQDSVADEAYDNAFEEAVGGGFGAWRLRAKYEDEEDGEDERQRIYIEPIFDADSSVFFDLEAKRYDKADAKYCFVLTSMTREAYEEEWGRPAPKSTPSNVTGGGGMPTSMPKIIHQSEFDWTTPDVVYVGEYYKVEEKKLTVHIFETIAGVEERYTSEDFEKDPDTDKGPGLRERLEAEGSREVRQKKIKIRKVRKYIMNGAEILEDCGYIAGRCIPIIPVYGKRWFVDNVERCMGQVRLAKDAQRLKNMQLSRLGEISAYSTISKPILTPEQIAGHQVEWSEDNIKQYPYLLINPITDKDGNQVAGGPLGYTKPPEIPPAMAALMAITEEDMKEILGSPEKAEKMVSNTSGKAVELIQQRLDMQTFIYVSNFAKSMKRCGEVWLSMGRELYVEEKRRMKTVDESGSMDSVELMRPVVDQDSGEQVYDNDLADATFDVAVEVGPSSMSMKSATVRALTGMMAITDDPETKRVLQAMAMMNMEGEGIEDVRQFFRRQLIRLGAVKPTEQEMEELAAEAQAKGQQRDPNAEFLAAAAEEATAKAAQARANTVKTVADAELSRARTVQTLSEIDMDSQDHAVNMARGIGEIVTGQVAKSPPAGA